MVHGCCSNLDVRIREDRPCFLKVRSDFTKDFSGANVKRKNSDRRENTFFYIGKVMLAGLGTVGAFIQFTK